MVAESVTDSAASDPHSEFELFLDHNDLAGQRPHDAGNGQRAAAVRQVDVGNSDLLSRRGQRQCRADDVENAIGIAKHGFNRHAGKNALVGAGDNDVAAGGKAP